MTTRSDLEDVIRKDLDGWLRTEGYPAGRMFHPAGRLFPPAWNFDALVAHYADEIQAGARALVDGHLRLVKAAESVSAGVDDPFRGWDSGVTPSEWTWHPMADLHPESQGR